MNPGRAATRVPIRCHSRSYRFSGRVLPARGPASSLGSQSRERYDTERFMRVVWPRCCGECVSAGAQTTAPFPGGGNRWVATGVRRRLRRAHTSMRFSQWPAGVRKPTGATSLPRGLPQVRIRWFEAFGVLPLRVGAAHVALSRGARPSTPPLAPLTSWPSGISSRPAPWRSRAGRPTVRLLDLAVSIYLRL